MTAAAAGPEQTLVRELGVRGLSAHIFNITIGGGIVVLPALVAGGLGAAAPLAGSLGVLVPGADAPVARAAVLIAVFGVLAAVNIRGVSQETRVIEAVAVAKLVSLAITMIIGLLSGAELRELAVVAAVLTLAAAGYAVLRWRGRLAGASS